VGLLSQLLQGVAQRLRAFYQQLQQLGGKGINANKLNLIVTLAYHGKTLCVWQRLGGNMPGLQGVYRPAVTGQLQCWVGPGITGHGVVHLPAYVTNLIQLSGMGFYHQFQPFVVHKLQQPRILRQMRLGLFLQPLQKNVGNVAKQRRMRPNPGKGGLAEGVPFFGT